MQQGLLVLLSKKRCSALGGSVAAKALLDLKRLYQKAIALTQLELIAIALYLF